MFGRSKGNKNSPVLSTKEEFNQRRTPLDPSALIVKVLHALRC